MASGSEELLSAVTLIRRRESAIHSCKNYVPKWSQKPQELFKFFYLVGNYLVCNKGADTLSRKNIVRILCISPPLPCIVVHKGAFCGQLTPAY